MVKSRGTKGLFPIMLAGEGISAERPLLKVHRDTHFCILLSCKISCVRIELNHLQPPVCVSLNCVDSRQSSWMSGGCLKV